MPAPRKNRNAKKSAGQVAAAFRQVGVRMVSACHRRQPRERSPEASSVSSVTSGATRATVSVWCGQPRPGWLRLRLDALITMKRIVILLQIAVVVFVLTACTTTHTSPKQ
jgi:hypothetical protein